LKFSAIETVKFYEDENKNWRLPVYCIMCGACILRYRKIHQRLIYTLKQNSKPESLLAMAATVAWKKKFTGREMDIYRKVCSLCTKFNPT